MDPELNLLIDNVRAVNSLEKPIGQLLQGVDAIPLKFKDLLQTLKLKEWKEGMDLTDQLTAERVRSVSTGMGHLVLQADPREFPIKDENFIRAVQRRIVGALVVHEPNSHCAMCHNAVDDQAEHMLACKHVGKNWCTTSSTSNQDRPWTSLAPTLPCTTTSRARSRTSTLCSLLLNQTRTRRRAA